MPDIELLNISNINCKTLGIDKEDKGEYCNMRKESILRAGSEQCCASTGLERSGAKTNSNTSCYTNSGSNSNLNNRLETPPYQTIMKLNISFQALAWRVTKTASTEITKQL